MTLLPPRARTLLLLLATLLAAAVATSSCGGSAPAGGGSSGPGESPAASPGSTARPSAPATRVPTLGAEAARYPIGLSYGERLSFLPSADLDHTLDAAVALHVNWIRVDLSWATVQADGPDRWDWAGFDRVVAAARARGLHVLAIATYTPSWARDGGCDSFTCPPSDPAAFAAFARTAAERYAGKVQAYEVWNEPNLSYFWRQPDPSAYGRLLSLAEPGIHAADPSATVLLGGLSAAAVGEGSIDPVRFLTDACRGGYCRGVDGVAYHPYTFPSPPLGGRSDSWRRISRTTAAGPSLRAAMATVGIDVPVWVTEYGAPTGGDDVHVSEPRQASLIARAVGAAVADPGIAGVFVYTWEDLADAAASPEGHFGIVTATGRHKPAYDALRDAARLAHQRR